VVALGIADIYGVFEVIACNKLFVGFCLGELCVTSAHEAFKIIRKLMCLKKSFNITFLTVAYNKKTVF